MANAVALQGGVSGELISYLGLVLVHDNRAEMEWLFPKMKVVEVTMKDGHLADGRLTMSVKDHPQFEGIHWPLRKDEFNSP